MRTVRVVKGPSSIVYGPMTVGGAIDPQTIKDDAGKAVVEVTQFDEKAPIEKGSGWTLSRPSSSTAETTALAHRIARAGGFDLDHFSTFFIQEECSHFDWYLSMNRCCVFLHCFFLDDAQNLQCR